MRIRELVVKSREELVDIRCDICGDSCDRTGDANYEYGTLEAGWGYYSAGKDGISESCDLCQECFAKVVAFIESIGGKVKKEVY